ncbi:autotransporter outer membrane beta-barrel domain-containing protein [Pseudomonas sp. PD9R]|uniref:autotransporter outer membrane beta-barrel domain-containing protein n=1 Tax=Pseudomonas sp. PD9R TaxID=2853534 RepID=UPI001C453BB3|nr:autotransporter outer membrane beta-barrel domain-containing protein [Pseudomonas sp. PD9R]MBV6823777.1 autotransporter outer membrane beta-barrel domain-containing protein [Pseudomonas sp. PD9R]
MSIPNALSLNPITITLKFISVAPLLLLAQQALAANIPVDNRIEDINAATPLNSYSLFNSATLNATSASTEQISAASGSTVNLNGSVVTATGTNVGLTLVDSKGVINNSVINGTTTAISLGATPSGAGSEATVENNSIIRGGARGALVGNGSTLNLRNSTVQGTDANGVGLVMFDSTLSATAGSTVVGGQNGIMVRDDPTQPRGSTLNLDNTHVVGLNGSAIVIQGIGTDAPQADINVSNGSTLRGGNGTLLDVRGGNALVNVNVSDSNTHLVGDIVVQAGNTANVTLQNASTLTGRLENVSRLSVNSNATWIMVGDGDVANLSMAGGKIQFGSPTDFYKLNVGNLSGNGTFIMDVNFATGQVDTLNVIGTATGSHTVAMSSSGADPVGLDTIPVVHIASGDATFSLLNGPVELGAFSYDLIKQGNNDWVLNTASRVISPGTQSILALFNTAPTIWYGELSTLRTRMGEVRMDEGKAGGWIRAYGNKFDVSASSGVGYQQTQQGFSFGADAPLPVGSGHWLVGLLGGYSKSDLDLSHGSTGNVDSYYLGAYTTWLDDKGYYFDGVLKFNRFKNESKVLLSDGKQTKGSYNNNGVGASLEFGRHIKLDNEYFVEPFAQLAGLIVQGQDYDLDNGLSADGDRTRSLLGKLGATVGRNFLLDDGKQLQPYFRAAYVHEFANNNEVQVNNNRFNNDLSGSRGELGLGVAMTLTDKVSVHADFDYSNGDKIEQPWGANIGVRYNW